LAQFLVDKLNHVALDIGVQLALGLSLELRLREFDANNRRQTFANVVAGQVLFYVLEQTRGLTGCVDRTGQRAAEAAQIRTAINSVDVVRETENAVAVGVVVLQRDFHGDGAPVGQVALALEMDRLLVQDVLALVQVLDEFSDAAAKMELGCLSWFL